MCERDMGIVARCSTKICWFNNDDLNLLCSFFLLQKHGRRHSRKPEKQIRIYRLWTWLQNRLDNINGAMAAQAISFSFFLECMLPFTLGFGVVFVHS